MKILRPMFISLATLVAAIVFVILIGFIFFAISDMGSRSFARSMKVHLWICVSVGIVLAGVLGVIRWLWRQPMPSIAFINKPHQEAIDAVLRLLRARARVLVWASIACGVLILAVVAWCLLRFSTADISASRVDVDVELYAVQQQRDALLNALRRSARNLATLDKNDEFERAVLRKEYDSLSAELAALPTSAAEIRKSKVDQGEDNRVLVFSITNKLGGVLILLFVVKLLISLYRYNTRLSAFYSSRADAIQLSAGDTALDLKNLSDVLFPSRIDYSDKIRTPAEEVLERAKDIVVAARPRS